MTRRTQTKPATVPDRAKQAGEIRGRWPWVEASVWTERMLAALESGVKGGKWFSLIDKVYSLDNLRSAFHRVKRNRGAAGVDHQTIEMYERDLESNLERLREELKQGSYRPRPVKRVEIAKLGSKEKRPLGIPCVRDRVAQTALRHVLEPIFEKDFAETSYGFRPGRGCMEALDRVETLLGGDHRYVVDADLRSYFDSIPHARLMNLVAEKITDGRVLALLESYLQQDVMYGAQSWTPQRGSPQGAVVSPLLSNIYLDPLDQRMVALGFEMCRYADDFVILCRSADEAEEAMAQVQDWVASAGLELHPEKTRIVDTWKAGESFEFLGFEYRGRYPRPRKKSLHRLKEVIRSKTRRMNGTSLKCIISNVNRTLVGWFHYFQRGDQRTFVVLDKWIRMRLRSILRWRIGLEGRGRGRDHHRWPNSFFAEHGLLSLVAAHTEVRQSSKR